MGIYDDLDNGKWGKPIKGGIFAELDKQSVISPTIKQRFLGTPVQQKDGTFTPTTGMLPFIKSIPKAAGDTAKSFVEGTIQTGRTLGQSIATNTGAFDSLNKSNQESSDISLNLVKQINKNKQIGKDTSGLEGAYNLLSGTSRQTQESITPNTTKTNLQALGDILKLATEALAVGEVATSGKSGVLLVRSQINKYLANKTVSETEKILAKKALFNIASGYGYDVGESLSKGKTGGQALKPGLGSLLSTIFTGAEIKGVLPGVRATEQSILRNRAIERANLGAIPNVGIPLSGYQNPGIKQLSAPRAKTDLFVGPAGASPNINDAEFGVNGMNTRKPVQIYDTPKGNNYIPDAQLPVITAKDVRAPDKNEFNAVKPITKQSSREVVPTLKQEPIASSVETPKPNAVTLETLNVQRNDTKFSPEDISSGADKIKNDLPPGEHLKVSLEDQSNKAHIFISQNGIENTLNALKNGSLLPDDLRPDALFSILDNEVNKPGNGRFLVDMVKLRPKISGVSGQNLMLNKLRNPGSASAVVEDILDSFGKNKPFLTRSAEKIEKASITKQLKSAIDGFTDDKNNIIAALKEIIC